MTKSLYDIILNNIEDGILKDGFTLPAEEDDPASGFADGALDGITMYHAETKDLDASGTKQMIKALKLGSEGNAEEADRCFAELGRSHRAICCVDDIQNYIMSNKRRFEGGRLFGSAMWIILNSADRESVKFGMEIMELLELEEPAKNVIRRMGLCEEFTVFAVWCMMNWDGGNNEIFDLIKKVRGWGRIHALNFLDPETDEVKDWILHHGIENCVDPSYSAFDSWEKSDAAGRLKNRLTEEEFRSIGRIIDALLDEGPVLGISRLDDAEEAMLDYLSQARSFDLTAEDYETVMEICIWAADVDDGHPDVSAECTEMLSSADCMEKAAKAAGQGRCLGLAEDLEIDYAESFFECFRNDFENQYRKCSFLTCFDDYLKPVLKVFRYKLNPEDLFRGRDDGKETGPEVYDQLNSILLALGDHPGAGKDLLAAGLRSGMPATREIALHAISLWTAALDQPVSEISEKLLSELKKLDKKETESELREMIRNLIDGMILDLSDTEEYPDE